MKRLSIEVMVDGETARRSRVGGAEIIAAHFRSALDSMWDAGLATLLDVPNMRDEKPVAILFRVVAAPVYPPPPEEDAEAIR